MSKPRVSFITLAVDDLERSAAFYRDGLGWPTQAVVGDEFLDEVTGAHGTIVFIELPHGQMLGLYERKNLAKDASIGVHPVSSSEFSLGYLAPSKAAVDELIEKAVAAGARLNAPAHKRPWGIYSAYITDLDGHLWEIGWDPRFNIEGE